MHNRVSRIVLALASLVAVSIGLSLVVAPAAFEASAGITFDGNPSALSESRGAGGGLLAIGLLVALGGFEARYRRPALLLAGLAYLGYGLARALGILLDGMPALTLQLAMGVELAMGVACLALLRGSAAPRGTLPSTSG